MLSACTNSRESTASNVIKVRYLRKGLGLGWIPIKGFSPRGWLNTGTGAVVRAPSPDRAQELFGQYSWAQGGIVGMLYTGPGVGFDGPNESLPPHSVTPRNTNINTNLKHPSTAWLLLSPEPLSAKRATNRQQDAPLLCLPAPHSTGNSCCVWHGRFEGKQCSS